MSVPVHVNPTDPIFQTVTGTQPIPTPFCSRYQHESQQRNYKSTYDNAVRASDGRAAAGGARADANDTDRAARQAQEDVDVAGVDADGLEDGRACRRACLQQRASVRCLSHATRVGRTGSVLAQQAVVPVTCPPSLPRTGIMGVAAARTGRAAVARMARRENMVGLVSEVCEVHKTLENAGDEFSSAQGFYTRCAGRTYLLRMRTSFCTREHLWSRSQQMKRLRSDRWHEDMPACAGYPWPTNHRRYMSSNTDIFHVQVESSYECLEERNRGRNEGMMNKYVRDFEVHVHTYAMPPFEASRATRSPSEDRGATVDV